MAEVAAEVRSARSDIARIDERDGPADEDLRPIVAELEARVDRLERLLAGTAAVLATAVPMSDAEERAGRGRL